MAFPPDGKGMAKFKPATDPRGHSLRVYSDVYDSPAFAALTPHDVMAYLALLRVLKGYNNGDLSLPLSRAKDCGISHPKTLARSLRALCAVGLVALARKGGSTKGGQRLPSLYRVTDRECHAKRHETADEAIERAGLEGMTGSILVVPETMAQDEWEATMKDSISNDSPQNSQ